jgi:hypothetical protein
MESSPVRPSYFKKPVDSGRSVMRVGVVVRPATSPTFSQFGPSG